MQAARSAISRAFFFFFFFFNPATPKYTHISFDHRPKRKKVCHKKKPMPELSLQWRSGPGRSLGEASKDQSPRTPTLQRRAASRPLTATGTITTLIIITCSQHPTLTHWGPHAGCRSHDPTSHTEATTRLRHPSSHPTVPHRERLRAPDRLSEIGRGRQAPAVNHTQVTIISVAPCRTTRTPCS